MLKEEEVCSVMYMCVIKEEEVCSVMYRCVIKEEEVYGIMSVTKSSGDVLVKENNVLHRLCVSMTERLVIY